MISVIVPVLVGLLFAVIAFAPKLAEFDTSFQNDKPLPPEPGNLLTDEIQDVDFMKRANLEAFLKMIREGESAQRYDALNGKKSPENTFSDFSDHPFKNINFRDTGRKSSASGAYQIVIGTWLMLGGKEKYGDFSPESQDKAAIDLLKRRGAYEDVLAGRFEVAVNKLKKEWDFFNNLPYSNFAFAEKKIVEYLA